jgi:hypothetical protein
MLPEVILLDVGADGVLRQPKTEFSLDKRWRRGMFYLSLALRPAAMKPEVPQCTGSVIEWNSIPVTMPLPRPERSGYDRTQRSRSHLRTLR